MSLSKIKIDMSRNDKNAIELVDKESVVCDGRFVVPFLLSKVTNELPNNGFNRVRTVRPHQAF